VEKRELFVNGGGIAKDFVLPDFHACHKVMAVEYDPSRHVRSRKKQTAGGAEEDRITLRNERFVVPEILFHPSDVGLNQPSLADIVMQSLAELPVGLWPALLHNIVIVGGCARIPGIAARLEQEIVKRAPDECIVRVTVPTDVDPALSTWTGGVNLARHEHMDRLAITKQQYEEYGAAWVVRKFSAGLGAS